MVSSDSTKKHQPNQPISSQSFAGTSSSLHPQAGPSLASSTAERRFVAIAPRVENKRPKLILPRFPPPQPNLYHPFGQQLPRGQVMNRLPPSVPTSSSEPANSFNPFLFQNANSFNPFVLQNANCFNPISLVGRKVRTRWPADDTFYEASIAMYDVFEGRHALVYSSWKWVKLWEIPPEDIEWIGGDPGINRTTRPKNDPQQGTSLAKNTITEDAKAIISQLRNTSEQIREVERVLNQDNPDPQEVERAKRVLKEHDRDLRGAIAKLKDLDNRKEEGASKP